jgi:hypothetical protein
MVVVLDEINLANLRKFYRRQGRLFIVSPVNAGPAISEVALPGEEGAVEIVVTPFTAYDFVQGDSL